MKNFKKIIGLLLIPVLVLSSTTNAYAFLNNEFFYSSNNIETYGEDAENSFASGKFVYYSQADPEWIDAPYSSFTTIGVGGCGPTSVAMIVATLIDSKVKPTDVADLGAANNSVIEGVGTSHDALLSAASEKWGFTYTNITDQGLDFALAYVAGNATTVKGLVYISGAGEAPFTGGGHIVVIRGVTSSGDIVVADPYGNDPDTERGESDIYPRSVIEKYYGSIYGIKK